MAAKTISKKTALITGCSEGGIGYALAKEFLSRGLHVFATARNPDKVASLAKNPNVTVLALDVTSAESIDAAVASVSSLTGGRLDYLVNNSGSQYVMPIIDADLQKARDMFDVNFWGVLAVSKAFAPLTIAAKGSIANIASIAGLMYPPYMGLYAATKASAVTISETLRLELKPFGVKVVTVISGGVESNLFANSPDHHLPGGSYYAAAEKEIAKRATGTDVGANTQSREQYARALVGDILGGASGKVYRGKMSTLVRIVTTYMPTWLIDILSRSDTGLERLGTK